MLVGEPGQDRRVEDAGRDGADPDRPLRQVARGVQRHADDAGLGRGVGQLPDLPLPGRDRGGQHEDAAVAVARRRCAAIADGGEAQHVEGADHVDPQHRLEQLERPG